MGVSISLLAVQMVDGEEFETPMIPAMGLKKMILPSSAVNDSAHHCADVNVCAHVYVSMYVYAYVYVDDGEYAYVCLSGGNGSISISLCVYVAPPRTV